MQTAPSPTRTTPSLLHRIVPSPQHLAERAEARRWWILLCLCCSLIVIVLDNTILNVALPRIQEDLNATQSQLAWMVDSYTLVFACLLLTAGSLGDRFGRRGGLQLGLVIFGLGSFLSTLATTPGQLIGTRALMGVGGAFIMPATLSILTNVFPPAERGKAIGIWAGVSGLGIALGPLAGGTLLEHFSWSSIFFVNIPIVILALLAGWFLIPTSKDPAAPKLDVPGALLSIVGLTALVFGLIQAPDHGWTSPEILAAFAIGAIVLGIFVWWETHTPQPMLDVSFFKKARFTAASAGITLVFFGMFGVTFLVTQYFQFVLDYTPLETGVRLLPWALTVMVVAPLSSIFVRRFGTKLVVGTGLTMATVGLILMTGFGVDTSYADIVWRMMVLAAGMGLVMAPATDSIMGSVPLAKAGVGSAVNDTTRQVGGALGVAVIGSVLASVYGSKIGDFLSRSAVPAPAVSEIKKGLGNAIYFANHATGVPSGAREALVQAAKSSFVDGLVIAALVGALASALGALVVFVWLPARAEDADVHQQEADRAEELGLAPAPSTYAPDDPEPPRFSDAPAVV